MLVGVTFFFKNVGGEASIYYFDQPRGLRIIDSREA